MTRAARSAMGRQPTHSLVDEHSVHGRRRPARRSCSARASRSTAGRRRAPAAAPAAGAAAAPVATIAARVERIRGLRFETPPAPAEVSPAQAKRDGLEDLDRSYPPPSAASTRRCSSCSGCSSPGSTCATCRRPCSARASRATTTRARSACGSCEGAQTDEPRPRGDHARPRAHPRARGPALRARPRGRSGSDDAALASSRSIEGSATAVMLTYGERHFSAEQTLGGLFASLGAGHRRPAAVRRGAAAVPVPRPASASSSGCTRPATTAGSVVDTADRFRPPASTEQVLHPEKYLAVEQPDRVARRRSLRGLGEGLAARPSGTWGEWATARAARQPGPARAGPRRPLRALAAPRRRLPGAVPPARRARHALALGHAPRRARVRDRAAARMAARPSRGPTRGPSAVARDAAREVTLALAPGRAGLARAPGPGPSLRAGGR